jgi:hypothetical protein
MIEDRDSLLFAHLRAIRTAIIGLALAVITTGLVIQGEPLDFPFLILTILVCLYSFVPPLIRS